MYKTYTKTNTYNGGESDSSYHGPQRHVSLVRVPFGPLFTFLSLSPEITITVRSVLPVRTGHHSPTHGPSAYFVVFAFVVFVLFARVPFVRRNGKNWKKIKMRAHAGMAQRAYTQKQRKTCPNVSKTAMRASLSNVSGGFFVDFTMAFDCKRSQRRGVRIFARNRPSRFRCFRKSGLGWKIH